MTHEKRAVVIKRCFLLAWAVAIVAGAWNFPINKKQVVDPNAIVVPEMKVLTIVHYALPGDPASEKLGVILARVQTRHGKQVTLTRVDPKPAAKGEPTQPVRKLPFVVMSIKEKEVYSFQGLRTSDAVGQKVEEILRGVERVGKDWRPTIQGLQPAGK